MLENDTQDVDLDNNEAADTEDEPEAAVPEAPDRMKELEAEAAKWKRIAERNAKKAKEPTSKDETGLLEKSYLRAAGISNQEEVELALTTAKKWDMPVDKLVDDEDFQAKLEKHRTAKANAAATSNVRGNKTGATVKDDPSYWIAKGTPPNRR